MSFKYKRVYLFMQFFSIFVCFSNPEGLSSHVQQESLVVKPVHERRAQDTVPKSVPGDK